MQNLTFFQKKSQKMTLFIVKSLQKFFPCPHAPIYCKKLPKIFFYFLHHKLAWIPKSLDCEAGPRSLWATQCNAHGHTVTDPPQHLRVSWLRSRARIAVRCAWCGSHPSALITGGSLPKILDYLRDILFYRCTDNWPHFTHVITTPPSVTALAVPPHSLALITYT